MDELVINATMDVKGFIAGTQRLNNAIKSFGTNVDRAMRNVQGAGKSILGTIMRWGPALLGVGGAYSIISKSVSAFMSQNQQLSNTLQACWNSIGSALGPIITNLVNLIAQAVQYLMAFLKLLGVSTTNSKNAGKAAGGAANELKKQLMGFDELNVLQDNKSGGGGGAGTLSEIEAPEWMKKFTDWLKQVWDLLAAGKWDEAADMIIDGIDMLIYTFRDKAEELGNAIGKYLGGALRVVSRVLDEVDWHALGQGIANLVNGVINNINGEDVGKLLVAKFTIAFKMLTGFLENLDWARIGRIISDAVVAALNAVERAITNADFKKIGAGIRAFFEQIDWKAIRDAIFGVLEAAWNGALDLLWGLIAGDSKEEPPVIGSLRKLGKQVEELAKTVSTKMAEIWEKLQPILESELKNFVDQLTDTLKDLTDLISGKMSFGEFIGQMNELETVLAILCGLKLAGFVVDLKNLISTIIGGGAAKGLAGFGSAASETAAGAAAAGEAVGGLGVTFGTVAGALGGGLLAALGLVPAVLLDSKLSAEYTAEALQDAGNSAGGLAEKYNELSGTASHYDQVLWESQAGIDNTGLSLQECQFAANALIDVQEALAEQLGITVEELQAQIQAADGDATKIAALAQEVQKEALTLEQALNNMTNLSFAMRRGHGDAEALTTAFYQYRDAMSHTDMTQEQAATSCNQLRGVLSTLEKQYGDSVGNMQLYNDVQVLLSQISEEYNIVLDEQGRILKDTETTIKNSADATAQSADAAQKAAEATNQAKESQAQMKTAMDEARQSSQNMVTEGQNLEQEMKNIAESGQTSASDLTTGYTDTVNAKAPEMSSATKEAGTKAGQGLEEGLDETDPAALAEGYTEQFKTGIENGTPKVENASKEMAEKAVNAAQIAVDSGTQKINQIINSSVNLIVQTIQNCGRSIDQAVNQSTNNVIQSFQMMQNTVVTSMEQVNKVCVQVFNNMIQLSGQAGQAIGQNFASGMTYMYSSVVNVATQLNSTFASYFGQIAQNGYVWGQDLGILFNNGLVDACNRYLKPTLTQVAQSIKNVIGFSKPKEGPLSDADTYMPDFMMLLASGVENYKDAPLDAVANLAEGVSEELANGDYNFGDFEANELDTAFSGFAEQFLNGFGSLIDRLDAIAERVVYSMPDIATGTVLPYSTSQEMAMNQPAGVSDVSEIVNAINSLRTLLTQNNGENAGFNITVLLDGEQIESAVSARQRRKRIAQGV